MWSQENPLRGRRRGAVRDASTSQVDRFRDPPALLRMTNKNGEPELPK
jgi:hypothetical protein